MPYRVQSLEQLKAQRGVINVARAFYNNNKTKKKPYNLDNLLQGTNCL